jgi:hypothetical protein
MGDANLSNTHTHIHKVIRFDQLMTFVLEYSKLLMFTIYPTARATVILCYTTDDLAFVCMWCVCMCVCLHLCLSICLKHTRTIIIQLSIWFCNKCQEACACNQIFWLIIIAYVHARLLNVFHLCVYTSIVCVYAAPKLCVKI